VLVKWEAEWVAELVRAFLEKREIISGCDGILRVIYTNLLYSFFWLIPWHLNFICQRFKTFCPIFIGSVSSRNNRNEIVGVFIQVKVCLENSLSHSEGGATGRGRVRVEK